MNDTFEGTPYIELRRSYKSDGLIKQIRGCARMGTAVWSLMKGVIPELDSFRKKGWKNGPYLRDMSASLADLISCFLEKEREKVKDYRNFLEKTSQGWNYYTGSGRIIT